MQALTQDIKDDNRYFHEPISRRGLKPRNLFKDRNITGKDMAQRNLSKKCSSNGGNKIWDATDPINEAPEHKILKRHHCCFEAAFQSQTLHGPAFQQCCFNFKDDDDLHMRPRQQYFILEHQLVKDTKTNNSTPRTAILKNTKMRYSGLGSRRSKMNPQQQLQHKDAISN